MKKPLQVVAGIVLNSKGEVLLAQRPKGKTLAGFWEFPGGKTNPGETTAEALIRELNEELELDVRIIKELGSFRHIYDWGTIDLHVFVAEALSEPQLTAEVQAIEWKQARGIEPSRLAPADIEPLQAFLNSRPKPV